MAEPANATSLSEHYLLKEIEDKTDIGSKPGDGSSVKEVTESAPVSVENSGPSDAAAGEIVEATDNSDNNVTVATPVTSEENNESSDQENVDNETSEIKLETAPGDYRFPTTNQSRHCFTRYVEYHRCVAAKGEGAPECDKFAKYYRSLCPGEWVDRWNEQRENGTFPGPL